METLTTTTPTTAALFTLTDSTLDDNTMAATPEPTYLKMEDLHQSSSSPASTADTHNYLSQSSPAPVVIKSNPAKKRKSWGQELPEPKTTLPPRKRAKTDDEKEQRRIERIKRNRAAAHNSRERKRQETQHLAVALAKVQQELNAYRQLHGPLPAHIVLPEVHLDTESEEVVVTPAPSLVESHGSQHGEAPPSPVSPADYIFQRQPTIKEEPLENFQLPQALSEFDFDVKSSAALSLDPTQHSAAMLCDLPCRSSQRSSSSTSEASRWALLILILMKASILSCQRSLVMAMWTIAPGQMARMMQASLATPSRWTNSSTTQLVQSMHRCLAQRNAATGLSTPRKQLTDRVATSQGELNVEQAQTHQPQTALMGHEIAEDQGLVDEWDDGAGR